jgi:transposase
VVIVELILYRLKTGCQWRELPIKAYLEGPYSWQSVFYHFNKWSLDGSWERVWQHLIAYFRACLDKSSVQVDGSHTRTRNHGQAIGYQGRKGSNTTNSLYMSDNQGVMLDMSEPESGQHHDLFDIEKHLGELFESVQGLGLSLEGLFLNADAGFDANNFRKACQAKEIELNVALNPRNGAVSDRDEYFDDELYKQRTVIERSFSILDSFKTLLIRFEITARNWKNWNIIGFIVHFIKILQKRKKI